MNTAFDKLSEEKKNLIIRTCVEEFGTKGYQNASTNKIIERAEISKGILFHYFGSKKELYLYLLKYLVSFFTEAMEKKAEGIQEKDFFKRVRAMLLIQLQSFAPYPNEYRLMTRAFSEPPPELKKEIQALYLETYQALHPLNSEFYAQYMEPARLREQVNLEQVMELLNLVFDQLIKKYLKSYRVRQMAMTDSTDQLMEELDGYLDVLKNGVYQSKGEEEPL